MIGNVLFYVVTVPLFGGWLYLMVRYVPANRRWFLRYSERELSRAGIEVRHDRWQLHQAVMYALGAFGPLRSFRALFRADPDSEIEQLRQETVRRIRPLIGAMAIGVVLWSVLAVAVLIVLLVHWLLA